MECFLVQAEALLLSPPTFTTDAAFVFLLMSLHKFPGSRKKCPQTDGKQRADGKVRRRWHVRETFNITQTDVTGDS